MAKNVALAVVVNPSGAMVIDATRAAPGTGVSPAMVRDFIEKDLTRYPDLRPKAAAIEEIVILSNEPISSDNYAQDMTRCYVKHMLDHDWQHPEGLHIFETFLGPIVIYIAYGT